MNSLYESMMVGAQRRGPQPCITWHGQQGRIELSVTSHVNAVSKAANFLVEGLMVDESSSVSVDLGVHWQSSVWLGALMIAGVQVAEEAQANFTIANKVRCDKWTGDPEHLIVVSRDPFGMPDRDLDARFVNASAQVRMFGDYFAPSWPVELEAIAVQSSGEVRTWDELTALVNQIASYHAIEQGSRYAIVGEGSLTERLVLHALLPLLHGNSVVLIDQDFTGDYQEVAAAEQVAHIVRLGA